MGDYTKEKIILSHTQLGNNTPSESPRPFNSSARCAYIPLKNGTCATLSSA